MNKLRAGALATVATVTVLTVLTVVAAPASAHVTVSAAGATPGGSDQIISFRVPTESVTASTVGLTVQLPTATPIASVLVEPHTGWTDRVTTVKLATPINTDDGDITQVVSVITWTASTPAAGIKPGQFGEFVVLAGKLPSAPTLTFKAIQTYSDSSTVSWIQTAAPGSTVQPDHPAPVLTLSAGQASSAAGSGSTQAAAPAQTASASNTGPIVLSVIALVVAAAALGLGFVSRATGART
ncbi:MAG: YcnI family protein [Actinomycetota bacterium]|nr:YcnI family protein [Actinomycetota bacterium]